VSAFVDGILGFPATRESHDVAGRPLALWRVADLERHVDRQALLAGDDPPEPPYWAHLWSGALVLAEAAASVPARSAVELGCGLGLPGLAAARAGARVVFVDRVAAPLAFVRASAAANGLGPPPCVVADFTAGALAARFDLVLAAEVLYDRAAFDAIAASLARLLAPGGRALVADGRRIDTRGFRWSLATAGLEWTGTTHAVREEGLPLTVDLLDIRSG
jgi:predicted nicotinamide N-methyase